MASDDNVVRLKHIKSLAQTVTDEIANITLHGGGGSNAMLPYDADFALYVPNETSIIITGKQTPELAIGSWSYAGDIYAPPNSTKVYTAPVTYNGDGTLSTDNGTISNGVLTVHDTDGIFSGVISASAGNDFSSSSLYFNRSVENVTVDNDTDINNAIQSVGAKFVPAVDNADDFANYSSFNVQFFDNRLKKILDGGKDYEAPPTCSFLNYTTSIETLASGTAIYLRSSKDNSSVSTGIYSSLASEFTLTYYKLAEKNGIVLFERKLTNGDYEYPSEAHFRRVYFGNSNGTIDLTARASIPNTITVANSSNASCEGYQVITALNSPKSNSIFFVGKSTDKHKTYGTVTYCRANRIQLTNESSSTVSVCTANTYVGVQTIYGALTSSTVAHTNYYDFAKAYAPVIEFNGESVSISKGSTPKDIPILHCDTLRSNSSGLPTIGGSFAYFGVEDNGVVARCTLTSIATADTVWGGTSYSKNDTITVNPWFEDDGSVILGLYPSTEYNNQYVITYKEGSYTKTNWLNDAFDVWIIENTASPKFTKTTKKIPDIADEIIL